MNASALDTSGSVFNLNGHLSVREITPQARIQWDDLSPFAQGYVEALFSGDIYHVEGIMIFDKKLPRGDRFWAFSDLAPEALSMILRDCDRWLRLYAATPSDKTNGERFWELRNLQLVTRRDFPPLRAHLGGDGKIALSQASGEAA